MPTSFADRVKANGKSRRTEVGRRLARFRKEAGYPQEAVAAALNYNQSDISRIERGDRTVDVVELENFAVLYSKPLDAFVTWQWRIDEDRLAGSQDGLQQETFRVRAEEAKLKRRWRWKNLKGNRTR